MSITITYQSEHGTAPASVMRALEFPSRCLYGAKEMINFETIGWGYKYNNCFTAQNMVTEQYIVFLSDVKLSWWDNGNGTYRAYFDKKTMESDKLYENGLDFAYAIVEPENYENEYATGFTNIIHAHYPAEKIDLSTTYFLVLGDDQITFTKNGNLEKTYWILVPPSDPVHGCWSSYFNIADGGLTLNGQSPDDYLPPYCVLLDDDLLPALTANGYVFTGWALDGKKVEPGCVAVYEDVTLTAMWEQAEDKPGAKIDHTSMLMGWLAGRWVARQRGKV